MDEQQWCRKLGPMDGFRPRCPECYGSIFARKFPENFRGKISAQKGMFSGVRGSVRAVSIASCDSDPYDIILDSSSDATVLPTSLIHAGVASNCSGAQLLDAQGKQIGVSDVRDIVFQFHTEDGSLIQIKDRAHFSEAVSHPIISYGKWLRNGWGSTPGDDGSFLAHYSGHKVPVGFKQNSLVLQGHVRVIASVRAIELDIPKSWKALQNGWYDLPDGAPICSSPAHTFVDASQNVFVHEWPYRTIVAMNDRGQWFVIELCKKLFYMEDREQPIKGNYRRLLTLMSKSVIAASDFGMIMADAAPQQHVVAQSSDAQVVAPDVPMEGAGGANANANANADANANANSSSSGNSGLAPSDAVQTPAQPSANGAIPVSIAVQHDLAESGVTIAGVQIYPTSAIAVLRAACKHLKISQSGSKSKLWQRILAFLDQQRILAESKLSSEVLAGYNREPRAVQTAAMPTDPAIIQQHMLTHLPYASWCPACVAGKDAQTFIDKMPARSSRESFQFFRWILHTLDVTYTRQSQNSSCRPPGTQMTGVQPDAEDKGPKLTKLVVHNSHSGAVHAIPVRSKDDVQHMVRECITFHKFLGYGDGCLRSDQEPALLQVEDSFQRALQKFGFKVVTENSRLLDHGGNSGAEKAIDRTRAMASVLLNQVNSNMDFVIRPGHALFSWAFLPASWILNRYVTVAGTTPHEVISGHAYTGKLCPVMCYVGDDVGRQKSDPKWRPGVFLGKTASNDMFIIHLEGNLRLTSVCPACLRGT